MRAVVWKVLLVAVAVGAFSSAAWASRTDGSMTDNGGYIWDCGASGTVQTPTNVNPNPGTCTFSFATKFIAAHPGGTQLSPPLSFSNGGLSLTESIVTACTGSCSENFDTTLYTHLTLTGSGPLNLFVTDPGTWGFVACAGTIQPSEYALYHCSEPSSPSSTALTTQFVITLPGSGSIDLYGVDFSDPNDFALVDAAGNQVGNLTPESVPSNVPEPASMILLATGTASVLLKRRTAK